MSAPTAPLSFSDRERLLAFSFATADLLLEVDHDLNVTFSSGAVRTLTGFAETEIVGRPLMSLLTSTDRTLVTMLLGRLGPDARLEPVFVSLVGKSGPVAVMLAGCRIDTGAPRYFLTVAKARPGMVPERRDAATGLLETADFASTVTAQSAQARKIGADVNMTMVELDKLEQFGVRAGKAGMDRLMGELGATLRSLSVGGHAAGRLGNDRFGVLHGSSVSPAAIRERVVALGRQIDPKAELGVTEKSMSLNGNDIRDEDAARVVMFAVRSFADKGIEHFVGGKLSNSMESLVQDTVARIEMVKKTLADRDIAVALQKIVGIGDRKIHHYEALCRTTDSDSPAAMIGFAEQVGLAGDIDLLVCGKVIDILNDATRKGIKPEIAVNMSAASLESEIFVSAFRTLVADHAALRPQILIEVTESAQIRDLSVANNILQQFRRDGHRVCLDDFGAGAAALPYIQALTVDYVKIDGAYVRRMLDDTRDTAILRAIVGLCRDLKMGTIAEMIETEPQAKRLLQLGVEFGQGYLFGRPMVDGALDGFKPATPQINARRKGYVETWT